MIGPGSLYTSLLPNLLVPDLLAAVHASRAMKIYVSNIATQAGETDLYSCYDHVRALEEHVGEDLFDLVLCNENYEGELNALSQWVRADERSQMDERVFCSDLRDNEHPWRHDSVKLSKAILDLYEQHSGHFGDRFS